MQKCVLVGVSSSIAAYKSVQLVSDLLKKGYDVEVMMTKNATKFITPLTFSSLTKHKTVYEMFEDDIDYDIKHISLAKKADVLIIAPATANVIAKLANGIADDFLTTTVLASKAPKIIAPAMNTNMYENEITKANLAKLKEMGFIIIEPEYGLLACKDEGKGKLANISTLIEVIESALVKDKYLKGKKVIVTAGPTKEAIDPVRFITNHSSGKMGYAIARAAYALGAEVTLVSGEVDLDKPYGVNMVQVKSAKEMFEAMKELYADSDYVIMAAAVADYRPLEYACGKIKKNSSSLELKLTKTDDILAYLGQHKTHQKLCGFAMETDDLLENAKHKFDIKNCDLLIANDLSEEGAGFKHDTNAVYIISDQEVKKMPLMAKSDLAYLILKALYEVK